MLHAKALLDVRNKEAEITALQNKYRETSREFNEKQLNGITILEGNIFIATLNSLEREIERQTASLKELEKLEEYRRKQVVASKIETSSLEKLREKKYEEYLQIEKKSEELFIEEFVSRQNVCK